MKEIEKLMERIEEYTDKYEFSFQLWGEGSMNVFIMKDGVDLYDMGGRDTIEEILTDTLEYMDRITKNNHANI